MNAQLDPTILLSTLTRTYELVQRGWCQGDYAQDEDGRTAMPSSNTACRWSFSGALHRSLSEKQQGALFPQVYRVVCQLLPQGHADPEDYSDLPTTTQADVLALLGRAIEGVNP